MRLKAEGKKTAFCSLLTISGKHSTRICHFAISQLMHMQCRLTMCFLWKWNSQKILGIIISRSQCTGQSSEEQGTLHTPKKLTEALNEFLRHRCCSLWLNALHSSYTCPCYSFRTPNRWKTDHTLPTFVLVQFAEAHSNFSTSDVTINHRN